MLGSGIPDCVAGTTAQESRMARFWLALLDDVLIWLNPLLGCVAAMLTILVLQAAGEYFAGSRMSPTAPVMVPATAASAVECRDATLPREWKEQCLYD
jgi:hypothetical protein